MVKCLQKWSKPRVELGTTESNLCNINSIDSNSIPLGIRSDFIIYFKEKKLNSLYEVNMRFVYNNFV